jgi:hypothetical protein
MSFELSPPPADVLADLTELEAVVAQDTAGERTRRMAEFLAEAELRSQEMRLRTTDFEERNFAGAVSESFAAARRILIQAWHKSHGHGLVF